jgi:dolichol-phosphate mannosyltransferase
MHTTVSIILPTYNECENIVTLINRILVVMDNNTEIIVVDDDSPDTTARIVAETYSGNGAVRLIVRKDEHGLASAIGRGISESHGDIVVWMDCDMSMPPEKIPLLVSKVADGFCDAAVGSRYCAGGKDGRGRLHKPMLLLHTFLSVVITRLSSLLLYRGFKDWTSGFIAVRRDILCRVSITGDYGEYFIALIYSLLSGGYTITEVPYTLTERKHGYSKTAQSVIGFVMRGYKYIFMIFSLKWGKPWLILNR